MFFAQIAFFSWLILAFHNKSFLPSKNAVFLSLLVFIAVFFLSSLSGISFQRSFWSTYERMTGLLAHLHLFGFFLAASSVFKEKDWSKILFSSTAIASLVSLISLYDRFIGIGFIELSKGSTLGNTSFLGTYLLFNAFIAAYLFLKNRQLGGITFTLIALGLLLNPGGRAALIGFFAGIVITALLWLFFSKRGVARVFAGTSIILIIIFSIFGFFLVLTPEEDFTTSFLEKLNLGTIGGRTVVWEVSINAFLERPLLGWGPENYTFAFFKNYNPCFGTERCGADTQYDRAHNFLFDTLVSIGIIGLISYLAVFASALFVLWKRFFLGKSDFWKAGIFTGLFAAYFIQGLTVFDIVSSLVMLFLIFAFIAKEEESFSGKTKETSFLFIAFIFFLFIFSLNSFIIKPYKGASYTIESLRKGFEIEILEKAIYSSPLGRYHIRQGLGKNIMGYQGANALKKTEFLTEEMRKEVEESPFDYNNYIVLGNLYLRQALFLHSYYSSKEEDIPEDIIEGIRERIDIAGRIFEKAIDLSPNMQRGYWNLAEARVRQERPEEALSLTEKAVSLEPNLFESHFFLIRIAKSALKDEEIVRQKTEEALKINPEWDFENL